MSELERLQDRFRMLIHNTCNTIGCKDCPYKWDGGCASTVLQDQIMDLEYGRDGSGANNQEVDGERI